MKKDFLYPAQQKFGKACSLTRRYAYLNLTIAKNFGLHPASKMATKQKRSAHKMSSV